MADPSVIMGDHPLDGSQKGVIGHDHRGVTGGSAMTTGWRREGFPVGPSGRVTAGRSTLDAYAE